MKSDTEEKTENFIRRAFKNEITWVLFIIGGVTGFYRTVVLPINNLQIQVAAIQTQLTTEQGKYNDLLASVKAVSDKEIEIDTKLKAHLNQ